MLVVMV